MLKLCALAFAALLATAAVAEPINAGDIHVSDGDTIYARGNTYRLVGFDTPETFKAKCAAERALGVTARARLQALVNGGGLDLTEVPCACAQKDRGTKWCNYGRACGTLKARGIDVGKVLIGEGLARPYVCGATRCPKRQGWCP